MGHPSEYFIKFTLASCWNEDTEDDSQHAINSSLESFGLPSINDYQYGVLKTSFEAPEDFKFGNKKHKVTRDFMKEEKISTLWSPAKDDKRVIPELVDGNMLIKHDLHILVMGQLPHSVVAEKLNKKYQLNPPITERMVDTYTHYFWNIRNTSHAEWEKLLEGHYAAGSLLSALYCGEQQAQYRAGFNPKIDGNRALKEVYRQAYFRIEAMRHLPDSKLTIDLLAKLTARMMNVHEALYSSGSGLQDQLKQFRQIMMENKDPAVKAVDEIINRLDGGSYSGDGDDSLPEGDQDNVH